MKTRLFWLFVLTCGLLLVMSMMVVAQEAPEAAEARLHALQTPQAFVAVPKPALAQAEPQAPENREAAPTKADRPQRPTPPQPLRTAYYLHAFYAFHYGDEAG